MNPHDAVIWLGGLFSPEAYLFWTRIQCLLWTGADLVLVFFLLRIADLARRICGKPPHRIPYAVLAATAAFAPLVALAQSGALIFVIELLVTIPHFLIILYIAAADRRTLALALRELVCA